MHRPSASASAFPEARRGNAPLVYELLRHGADVTALDANGVAPIFAAARRGRA